MTFPKTCDGFQLFKEISKFSTICFIDLCEDLTCHCLNWTILENPPSCIATRLLNNMEKNWKQNFKKFTTLVAKPLYNP